MTLDFPTFERPRNAISGNCGTGKCATSLAASMNRVSILITKPLTVIERTRKVDSAFVFSKPERPFWRMHVLFLDRPIFMPKIKNTGYGESDQYAHAEEQPIRRQSDQQHCHHSDGCNQPSRSAKRQSNSRLWFTWVHWSAPSLF